MQSLETVLNHPSIWRGDSCARVAVSGIPTGYAELDTALPGSGWPGGTLTEIYVERPGIGEMQLIMPAAARLTGAGRWITMIAPPYIPYPPALAAHGVRLSRVILVNATDAGERFWACEQALRSPRCGAVLAWIDHAPERALKRLQLAAEGGNTVALLFRSTRVIPASPAALRLHVSRAQSRTIVRVLKRRGCDLPAPIALDMPGCPSIPANSCRPVEIRPLEAVP
jgi:cell division inhibitor SulA/protein ImuA